MADVDGQAVGLIETRGLVGALEAADTMVKTASVRLIGIAKTVPALMTVQIAGDVASVQAAVQAGCLAAERVGQLVSSLVIPNPGAGVADLVDGSNEHDIRTRPQHSNVDLDEMTVVELRSLARETDGFPIQGRAIASASKQQLLEAFDALQS